MTFFIFDSLGGSGRSPLRLAIRSNHLSLAKSKIVSLSDEFPTALFRTFESQCRSTHTAELTGYSLCGPTRCHQHNVGFTIGTSKTLSGAFGQPTIDRFQYRTPLEGVQMRAADGQTPLHHACAYGHTSTAALLLQSGALLEAVDSRNQVTPEKIVVICFIYCP